MFSSRIIKAICFTILAIACAVAIILIFIGVNHLADKCREGWFFILIGILVPILAIIWVFPMYALANIDINLDSAKNEIENLNVKIQNIETCICREGKRYSHVNHALFIKDELISEMDYDNMDSPEVLSNTKNKAEIEKNEKQETNLQFDAYSKAIDFVNCKYCTNLTVADTPTIVKEKFDMIDNQTTSFAILKNKIKASKSFSEVANAIIMHKTIHDNYKK